MKKEYPTINGLEAVLKILKSLNVDIDYKHQEIIRGELQTYRKLILEDMFKINKDPVPNYAVEVSIEDGDKGIFIFFINPLDFVELINEDGNPASESEIQALSFQLLIGLLINKTNPEKTSIGFPPPEILLELKNSIPKKDEIIEIDEDFSKDNKKDIPLN